jgi:hypothetical protein
MGGRCGFVPLPAHRAEDVITADHHQVSAVRADEAVVLPGALKQPGSIPSVLLELTSDLGILRQLAQQWQVILADRPQRHLLGHGQIMPRPHAPAIAGGSSLSPAGYRLVSQGFLDAPGAGGADALVDRKGLPQARGTFLGGAVVEVCVAESL